MNFERAAIAKLCLWMVVVLGCGCSKREAPNRGSENSPTESPRPLLEACGLLTSEEVAAVMGEAVKETKKLEETERGFHVTMCLFSLPTTTDSITLRLVQRAEGAEARDPREAWNESFSHEKLQAKRPPAREEIESPEKIAQLGEEAFWRGNAKGGALYVLKGNTYLRFAITDSRDKETAIKKCSALAEMALKRL